MRFSTWAVFISIGLTLADARELRGRNLRPPIETKKQKSFFLDDEREWENEIWKRVFFDGDIAMSMPSLSPSSSPDTNRPTRRPSKEPVTPETDAPTITTPLPSAAPNTVAPTPVPTNLTIEPTNQPSTSLPTEKPSQKPSIFLTGSPTTAPFPRETLPPTIAPTMVAPTNIPTRNPVLAPSKAPIPPETASPSRSPIEEPIPLPTSIPTETPTKTPVAPPSRAPTRAPMLPDTLVPTSLPTKAPTRVPTFPPTTAPVPLPTAAPTRVPTTLAPNTPQPVTAAPTSAPAVPDTLSPTESLVTLIELVQTRPRTTTLNSLVNVADQNRTVPPLLSNVLGSAGPFTLFAPTNTAFSSLETTEPGYLEQLLTPEYGLHLFVLLAYHTAPGSLKRDDFPVTNLAMLDGGSTNVTDGPPYFVDSFSPSSAEIVAPPDVAATNGVLHFIDNVLLPSFVDQNPVTALQAQGDQFSTWLRLIEAAGLSTTFANFNNVAMLAPVNSAIPLEIEQFLLQPGNEEVLTAVLSYHVMITMFNYAIQEVPNIYLLNTTQFENIVSGIIIVDDAGDVSVSYNQATQIGFFLSKTTIIYVIDRMLIPPSLATVVPRSSSSPLSAFSFNETVSMRRPDSYLMMGDPGPT